MADEMTDSNHSIESHEIEAVSSSSLSRSSSKSAERMQSDLFPNRVDLPHNNSPLHTDNITERRTVAYKAYTASTSVMLHVPVDKEIPDSIQPQLHQRYYIKTVATTKCDDCQQRCKGKSEVYQCRDCAAQICRECVEENFEKEKIGEAGTSWEWRGSYHIPFKLAYLQRKSENSDESGKGEWIGTVKIPGPTTTTASVSIEYTPVNTTTTKSDIQRSRVCEASVHPDEQEDQKAHVRNQAIGFGSRQKLDRILNAFTPPPIELSNGSNLSRIIRQGVSSSIIKNHSSHNDQNRLSIPFLLSNTQKIISFDGPSDDASAATTLPDLSDQEERDGKELESHSIETTTIPRNLLQTRIQDDVFLTSPRPEQQQQTSFPPARDATINAASSSIDSSTTYSQQDSKSDSGDDPETEAEQGGAPIIPTADDDNNTNNTFLEEQPSPYPQSPIPVVYQLPRPRTPPSALFPRLRRRRARAAATTAPGRAPYSPTPLGSRQPRRQQEAAGGGATTTTTTPPPQIPLMLMPPPPLPPRRRTARFHIHEDQSSRPAPARLGSPIHFRPLSDVSRTGARGQDAVVVADAATEMRLVLPVQGPAERPLEYAVRLAGWLEVFLGRAREGEGADAGAGAGEDGEGW